jgi:hypothetical protein
MPQFQKDHGYSSHRRRQPTDPFMRHVLTLSLACCWLTAPVMAAEVEACRNLLEQRNALAEQAMKAEIALVRTTRERICPVLSQQADGANANDHNETTIDYQALIECRHKAEEQLLRSQRVLYVNRQQFRFYTAAGAKLARQADGLNQELRDRECPQLR